MVTSPSAQTRRSGRRAILITAGAVLVAGAVVATVVFTSRPTPSVLAGAPPTSSSAGMSMDHSSGDMPGMPGMGADEHGSGDMPGMSGMSPDEHGSQPTTNTSGATPGTPGAAGHEHGSGDMPGMPGMSADEHGSGDMPGMPGMSEDEHSKASDAPVDRPLVPVLGTFGGGTSAVLFMAGLLRRKDRARSQAKAAARAARGARS